MLKNYFKIAWRNVQRHKIFSAVNLIGLSLSLSAVILISLYIRFETSYDTYSPVAKQVYRVYMKDRKANTTKNEIMLPKGLGKMLKDEFPEVLSFTEVSIGQREYQYKEAKGTLHSLNASEEFFTVFPFHFISGNPKTALSERSSVVLTKSAARKIFGDVNPINKVLSGIYKVTGVIDDIPANTHFKAEIISAFRAKEPLSWTTYLSTLHYVLLKKNTDEKRLEKSFKSVKKKYAFPEEKDMYLQNVSDIHLRSHSESELDANSDVRYVYIFFCVAVLLLIIASINYVNLSTARSLHRAREVGVRKVLGASRKDLIKQFLGETFLFFGLSAVFAFILSWIFYPALKQFMNLSQAEVNLYDVTTLGILLGCFFVFSFFAGLYPAFYLTRQKTAEVIKGYATSEGNTSSLLRRGLVVFQFQYPHFSYLPQLPYTGSCTLLVIKTLGLIRNNWWLLEIIPVIPQQLSVMR